MKTSAFVALAVAAAAHAQQPAGPASRYDFVVTAGFGHGSRGAPHARRHTGGIGSSGEGTGSQDRSDPGERIPGWRPFREIADWLVARMR